MVNCCKVLLTVSFGFARNVIFTTNLYLIRTASAKTRVFHLRLLKSFNLQILPDMDVDVVADEV